MSGEINDYGTLGLRDVHLPDYWSDRRIPIAITNANAEIERSDQYRLSENPSVVFYQAFRSSLQKFNKAQVYNAPWPPETKPKHRIEIFITSLIGELGGKVEMEGYGYVIGEKSQQIHFNTSEKTADTTIDAYLQSIAIGIDDAVKVIYSRF